MKYIIIGDNDEVIGGGDAPAEADLTHLGATIEVPPDTDIRVYQQWWDGEILQSVPVSPSSHHVWDWTTKTWIMSPTIRADMKALVTAEAVRRNNMPFNYSGHYYRCDAQGQAAIMASAVRYPTTVPSGWTWPDINGVPVAMNSTEWSLFWVAVADRPLGIQVVVEFLHNFIDDTGHSEEVIAAIAPSTDSYWPETARP